MNSSSANLEGEGLPSAGLIEPGRVAARFGEEIATSGFQPLPDVLLFNQAELGVKSEDLNVLLNILAHWYLPDRMPYPRPHTIAKRMGVSLRTVQRSMTRLRRLGMIAKGAKNEDGRTAIDVTPLLDKLRPYAKKRRAERTAAASGLFGVA